MSGLSGAEALVVAVPVILAVLTAAFVIALLRLARGPSLPDRVVALDMIGYVSVGFLAVLSVGSGTPALIQPAIVLAFLAFLGTVAFARYVERMGTDRKRGGKETR